MFDFEFHDYQEMIVDLLRGTKVDIFFLISHKKMDNFYSYLSKIY